MQILAFKRSARDDALCFGSIDNFPRFANLLAARKFFPKCVFEPTAAPDSFHEDWFKGEGTADFGFRISDFGFQIGKFVGRFCETPFILAPDTDALQDECDLFSNTGCRC